MRIAVIGAGIVGVATAYELAADGHEVTVFDRRSTVAAESSFAHIGFVSQCMATPWVLPGDRAAMLRQLLRHNGTWPQPGALAHWRWLARWWRSCGTAGQSLQRRAVCALQRLSQQRLQELRTRLPLDYERTQGLLLLARTDADLATARRHLEAWRELGIQAREIAAAQCHALEPDLNTAEPLSGVLHLHADETGNCRQVAHLLRDAAENNHDVEFRFALGVKRIDISGARPRLEVEQLSAAKEFATTAGPLVRGVAHEARTQRKADAAASSGPADAGDELSFDAAVVCAGVESSALLRPLGLHLPLLPVHGYSATFALRVKEIGPRGALIDAQHEVAIARAATRVRVTGGAELAGDPKRMRQATLATLHKSLQDWYPGSVHMTQPQVWKGSRPTLPDGPPVIGPSGIAHVWLNLGHGHSGWALACGSARLLADQIGKRTPAIDPAPFSVQHYAG